MKASINRNRRQNIVASRVGKDLEHASLLEGAIDGDGEERTLSFDELAAEVVLGAAVTAHGGQVASFDLEGVDGYGGLKCGWCNDGDGEEGEEREEGEELDCVAFGVTLMGKGEGLRLESCMIGVRWMGYGFT